MTIFVNSHPLFYFCLLLLVLHLAIMLGIAISPQLVDVSLWNGGSSDEAHCDLYVKCSCNVLCVT